MRWNLLSDMTRKIGDILINEGLITKDVLDKAVEIQNQTGGRLGEVLIGMGALSTRQFYHSLAKQLHVSYCDLNTTIPNNEALRLFTPT